MSYKKPNPVRDKIVELVGNPHTATVEQHLSAVEPYFIRWLQENPEMLLEVVASTLKYHLHTYVKSHTKESQHERQE